MIPFLSYSKLLQKMGNRHYNCNENELPLVVATEVPVEVKRPWLEPLSRNGIPLQIFGFRENSYRPEFGLPFDLDQTRQYLDAIIKFKGKWTDDYIMTKLRDLGIQELPPDLTIQNLLESAESMRKNGGNQEQIQLKLCTIFGLNEGDTKGNEIYTILFERIDGDNDSSTIQNTVRHKKHPFLIDFLELFERYYEKALLGGWDGIREIDLEAILRCMLQKQPPGCKFFFWNYAANSRKLRRDELLHFADDFDDQLLQECSNLNKRETKHLSPRQKCIRYKYLARYIRESLEIEGIHVRVNELNGLVHEINFQRKMSKRSNASREFVGLWRAMDKANSLSLKKISLQEILSMHEMVLAEDKKMEEDKKMGGKLRKQDMIITNTPFVPVEPRYVEEEMARFMTLINHGADQFPRLKENPVEFAALVHFIFVLIHPFGDGNGRMGRLLMNYVLENFGYPALILMGDNENRQLYYRAIHQACMGNVRAFVRYIAEQMLRTLWAFKAEGEYTLAHIENPLQFAKSWP